LANSCCGFFCACRNSLIKPWAIKKPTRKRIGL
jgi:hypothetical protein